MKQILVVVHIYYTEMWDELKEYLSNIFVPYDLYVTTVLQKEYIKDEIINFKSDTHFEIVENRGYDVGPFIHIMNKIDLDKYGYVIKIHTKRDMAIGTTINSYDCCGAKWRNLSLSFLKDNNFKKCLKYFKRNKTLGMIGNFHLIVQKEDKYDNKARQDAINLLQKVNLNFKKYTFIAGTMFMCRATLLKPLQQLKLKITDFDIPDEKHTTCLAHTIERFLGLCIYSQNSEIKDVFSSKTHWKICKILTPFRYLKRFIYQSKITSSNRKIIKICKIPILNKKEKEIKK